MPGRSQQRLLMYETGATRRHRGAHSSGFVGTYPQAWLKIQLDKVESGECNYGFFFKEDCHETHLSAFRCAA